MGDPFSLIYTFQVASFMGLLLSVLPNFPLLGITHFQLLYRLATTLSTISKLTTYCCNYFIFNYFLLQPL
jgi:hypothetical protein